MNNFLGYVALGIELKASCMLASILFIELTPITYFRDNKVLLILAYNFETHAGLKLAILLTQLPPVGFIDKNHHSYLLSLSSNCHLLH